MRSILVVLFLIIFLIVTIPLYLILSIVGLFNQNSKHKVSQGIVRIACKIILFLSGIKLSVIGLDNIPEDDAVLFVMNHSSYFDIIVLYATTPKKTAFIAKKSLGKIPLINIWIDLLNCLLIDRDDLKQSLKTILEAIEMVKSGYSIVIAPEGTRTSGKEMLPFKEGSLKIAEKSGCPVIPTSISNADNAFENHIPWIRRTHIIIEYGKPVYPNQLEKQDQKHLGRYVQNIVKQTLDKNEASLEF